MTTTTNNLDREARLAIGWQAEDEIIQTLKEHNIPFERPTGNQHSRLDKYAKIDGFAQINGHSQSCQIKNRENGNDILVEVWKDFDNDIPGRDMVSKAQTYICRTQNKTIYIIPATVIKKAINTLLETLANAEFDKTGWLRTSTACLKLALVDGAWKVVAFLRTDLLEYLPEVIVLKAACPAQAA